MPDYTHLQVGDEVVVSRNYRTDIDATVTKVGRVWLDVSSTGYGTVKVRRSDGRSEDGFLSISTRAEVEERQRHQAAVDQLRKVGLALSYNGEVRPSTDLLVELAAVVARHQEA